MMMMMIMRIVNFGGRGRQYESPKEALADWLGTRAVCMCAETCDKLCNACPGVVR